MPLSPRGGMAPEQSGAPRFRKGDGLLIGGKVPDLFDDLVGGLVHYWE